MLIFGADTITQEGANSILKLLEEPPGHLIMILTADQGHRVLPTIRSRCSIIPLAPMDQDGLVRLLLEQEKLDLSLARVAASLSEGRPGAALAVAGSDLLRKRRDIFEGEIERLNDMCDFAAVICEIPRSTVILDNNRHGARAKSIINTVSSWRVRFPGVHFCFCEGRYDAEQECWRLLSGWWWRRQRQRSHGVIAELVSDVWGEV